MLTANVSKSILKKEKKSVLDNITFILNVLLENGVASV